MIIAAAAVLVGAAAQSATGFGFALLAGPALFAVLDPEEAVALLAALGVVLSLLILADADRDLIGWRVLRPLLLAAIPGLGLGLLALEVFSKPAMQLVVGLAVIAAAVIQVRAGRPPEGERRARGGALGGGLVGVVSGALTTSIGVNGPPIVLWLEARGASPGEIRVTLAAAFLALNVAGFALLVAAHGAGDVAEPGRLLLLSGAVIAGHVVGAVAFRRLDASTFRVVVLSLVVAAGVLSTVAGVAGL